MRHTNRLRGQARILSAITDGMKSCSGHLDCITAAGLMGNGFVGGNASGNGCRCGVAGTQGISKKKPDGFDKRVWLQTRRIRSSRRANCKASVAIINVTQKYVKNQLKALVGPQSYGGFTQEYNPACSGARAEIAVGKVITLFSVLSALPGLNDCIQPTSKRNLLLGVIVSKAVK
jgi:hypothetical protein